MESQKMDKADLYNWVISLSDNFDEIERNSDEYLDFSIRQGSTWYQITHSLIYNTDWSRGAYLRIIEEKIKGLGEREYRNLFPDSKANELKEILNDKFAKHGKVQKLKEDISLEEFRERIDQIVEKAYSVVRLSNNAFIFKGYKGCLKLYFEPAELYGEQQPYLLIEKYEDKEKLDRAPVESTRIPGSAYLFQYITQALEEKYNRQSVVKVDIVEGLEGYIGNGFGL